MNERPSHDPSFHIGQTDSSELTETTRLRASQAFESHEPGQLDGTVDELLHSSFETGADWSEVTQQVMRGVVESISDPTDADWAIRRASHRAVLAVAKRWGNIVLAGKATVVASREAASRSGLDGVRAAQQAGLGAIEGVLQVGPVAYPVLQREISPIVEDLQEVLDEERRSGEWMLRSIERSSVVPPIVQRVEEPSVPLDLAPEDYEELLPPPPRSFEEATPVLEPLPEPEPVPLTVAPAPPKVSLWGRISGWFRGLFRKG